MFKGCRTKLFYITAILFIILICGDTTLKNSSADSGILSSSCVLKDDIHVLPLGNGRCYILSSNNSEGKSLISCFDANSKTFTSSQDVSYLYTAYDFDGESLYLVKNDSTDIKIEKYYISTVPDINLEYFDYETIKVRGKNLLNYNSIAVASNGDIFIIDTGGKLYVKPISGAIKEIGDAYSEFTNIKMNSTGDILYATHGNELVSFNLNNSYESRSISCSDAIPSNYSFINDNFIASSYGKIYKIDTDTNTLKLLYSIDEGVFFSEFDGKLLVGRMDGTLILSNFENKKIGNLELNDELKGLCVDNDSLIVLINHGNDKYIKIVKKSDFNMEPEDEDKGDNKGDEGIDDISSIGITSSRYNFDVNDYTITNVDLGTTIAEFKRNITYADYNLMFKNYTGKVITSGTLGTGAIVTFSKAEKSYTFTFIVEGDLTGEGNSNSRDVDILTKYLLGTGKLEGVYLKAADLSGDGEVTSADLCLLIKKLNS